MPPRTRTRGSAIPSSDRVTTTAASQYVSVVGDCEARYDKIPDTVSVTCRNYWAGDPDLRVTVKLPSNYFKWKKSEYGYTAVQATGDFGGALLNLLKPYLVRTNYAKRMLGTLPLSERIRVYDFDRMNDVTGSGFNKRRKTEFVVNPCDSIRNFFILNEAVPSSPNPQLSIVNAIYNVSLFTFQLKAAATPEIPFTMKAFSTLRSAWLPDREPSRFAFLYSEAASQVDQADFETLAALVELRETVSYLYHRLSTIGSILRSIRRRDFSFIKNWKNLSKEDLWLESRYAIRPLFYDVQSAIKALKNDGKLASTLSKCSVKSDASTVPRSFSFSADGYTYDVQGTHVYNYIAKGGAYARLTLDLETAYKFGLLNLASASWEAIPYSFIVDWFFSVSSFIAGLNPNPIYSIEAGYLSVASEDFFTGVISCSAADANKQFLFSDTVLRHARIPYDNRLNIAFDLNLNFYKFVDLCLIFGKR